MKKKFWIIGIASAFIAVAILFTYIKLNTVPSWVHKSQRNISVSENGLTRIELSKGKFFAYNDEEVVWNGEPDWIVQDALWGDIDFDESKELILLVWKKGLYGQAKPFWVTGDEMGYSQHIFIYDWDSEARRFDPIWMASDIQVDAKDIYFDSGSRNLFIVDPKGQETTWKWIGWGLSETNEKLTFIAVGDNLIHEPIYRIGLEKDDFSFLYNHIKSELDKADIACVNQETPFVKEPKDYGDYPAFGTPFEVADALKAAGFNVASCATNHAYDRDMKGIDCTYDTLQERGILPLGIESSQNKKYCPYQIMEKKGIRLALFNYTELLNGRVVAKDYPNAVHRLNSKEQIISDINMAKKGADLIVVFAHWGTEYDKFPDENQKEWTEIFLNAGVDLVIGTHPHVLQKYEMLERADGKKMLIYYSLGNFMSAQDQYDRIVGGMAKVSIGLTRNGYEITDYSMDEIITHQEPGYYSVFLKDNYPKALQKKHRLKNSFHNGDM